MKPLVVVMGVSGSGKSTIGALLAERLGVPFADADEFHSEASVLKMRNGHPLTDEDRWPWLERVGRLLAESENAGLVVACSALKRSYRELILSFEPRAEFVLLEGDRGTLERRLSTRKGHFMPGSLLDSQLEALEPLVPEESGVTVSVEQTPEEIVAEILLHESVG